MMSKHWHNKLVPIFSCILLCTSVLAHAEDAKPVTGGPSEKSNIAPEANKDNKTRDFYRVLEDVLADFEYDLENGKVRGLKDLSVRNIATSENVPSSFKNHLELLITERILNHSKGNLIQCLPCRSRRATLSGDNVRISTPDTNSAEMARIAKLSGISHFFDAAFSYQPRGLLLSMYVTDSQTGNVVWSRSYNSETSRAAMFRRGIDYSQIEENKNATEYEPTVMYRPTIYYLFERNPNKYTGVLGFGVRIVERYDNRKKEVGFELNYLMDSSTIAGGASSSASDPNIYSGLNLTLLFVHAWNFIGNVESYNRPRGSIFAAIGGTYASGFLGALIRTGYEWRLGKHWAVHGNIGYRPKGTVFISGSSVGSIAGLEFGVGVSALL